jgi:hypothetical protein
LRREGSRLQDTSAIDLDQGQLPEVSPLPFVALLLLGFVIGGFGHLYRWRPAIALGVVLIMTATIVLPIVTFLTSR